MRSAIVYTLVSLVLCSGCSLTKDNVNYAFVNIERVWKAENDLLKKELGTRMFRTKAEHCFSAAKETLDILGFTIQKEELGVGMIMATAPSPRPLSDNEWAKLKTIEEPKFKDLADQLLPGLGKHVMLTTRGWEIQALIVFTSQEGSTEVALGFTQVNPDISRRGYHEMKEPPPMTAKLAMLKFWMIYDIALKGAIGESRMLERSNL